MSWPSSFPPVPGGRAHPRQFLTSCHSFAPHTAAARERHPHGPDLQSSTFALLSCSAVALVLLAPARAVAQASGSASSSAPVTLAALLRDAPRAHPLVLAAEARLRAARGARATAGALVNPSLTYQVENLGFPGAAPPSGIDRETSIYGTLPLDPLWQRGARVERARNDILAAEADVVNIRRIVALDGARAFHRVALAQASVLASADVIVELDSLIRFTGARVREGATPEGDLLRLQVERERLGADQSLQEAELALARGSLLAYLPSDATRPAPSLADARTTDASATRPEPTSGRVTSAALSRSAAAADLALGRPDVIAARSRALAAESEVGLQRALSVRQLGATFGTKTIGSAHTMIAGITLPIPLFDRNRGEIERARGQSAALVEELRWTERRARGELAGAYEAARVLEERVRALDSNFVARAEASRRIALAARATRDTTVPHARPSRPAPASRARW